MNKMTILAELINWNNQVRATLIRVNSQRSRLNMKYLIHRWQPFYNLFHSETHTFAFIQQETNDTGPDSIYRDRSIIDRFLFVVCPEGQSWLRATTRAARRTNQQKIVIYRSNETKCTTWTGGCEGSQHWIERQKNLDLFRLRSRRSTLQTTSINQKIGFIGFEFDFAGEIFAIIDDRDTHSNGWTEILSHPEICKEERL